MRNVRHFTRSFQLRSQLQTKGGTPTGVIQDVASWQATIMRSQRSDSQPTVPASSGEYFRPTPYMAFFHTSSSASPGECLVYQSPTRNKRFWWDGAADGGNTYVTYGCSTNLTPAVSSKCLSDARSQILNNIRNNDLDLGQFVGEARESVRMIGDIVKQAVSLKKGLYRAITNARYYSKVDKTSVAREMAGLTVRQLKFSGVKGVSRRLNSEYLRFIYGVRPLMNDIYGIASVIQDGMGSSPLARAYRSLDDDTFKLPSDTSTVSWTGTVRRGVSIEVNYGLRNPVLHQLWRFGLTNPLSLAWELMTLSFVIDWFTGIGNFLKSFDTGVGCKFLSGYETVFLENSMVRHQLVTSQVLLSGVPYAKCELRTKAMRRSVGIGFPVPQIYLDLGLNTNQVINLISLLGSHVERR